MSHQLPAVWVEALFKRFTLTWGVQRVASTFQPPDYGHGWMDEVMQAWAVQLGGFNGPTIKAALQSAIDSGREWPPTLPEFKALCRQYNRPEHQQAALPAPGNGHTDAETARKNLARIHEMLASAVKRVPA